MLRRPFLALCCTWPMLAGAGSRMPAVSAERASTLIYPRHQGEDDPHLEYVLALLRLALQRSGKVYALRGSGQRMVQTRAMLEIELGTGSADIVWTMTSRAREAQLLPVRIPLDRGLLGWRVALVGAAQPQLLRHARTLADLRTLSAGQMRDWPDTAILQDNGLRVEASSNYEGLFQQLAIGRIDYFPRSVIEAEQELASHAHLPLAIDPYLVMRYPSAMYFFVSKQRPELARDLETGLEKALADGSFRQLFLQHFGKVIQRLRLDQRRVLELHNAGLPPETPLHRKELWFHPAHF
ncbi:substrate-binding periplasmic protein [Janthinobacterium sp. Mn2066]|uniref:substrate-binding periplasmic protein n=1 Tax=Janthinobacterium sp. Mn2066 TaxID=3395264 RepID=UPI003BC44C08